MSKFKKKQEQSEPVKSKSLYEQIKEVNDNDYGRLKEATLGFYNEIGLSAISKNPMKLYDNADKFIERYERWTENWKQLKKDCVQDILSKFSKEELQEAINNK